MNRRPASLPKRLHEHVVDDLGARIVRGDFAPGETLPVEDALVAQLGVSRTVVREAVKVLAQKNLLQVRTRIGTRVCAPSQWNQLDPDILRWRFAGGFDAKLIQDLVDLRRMIEPTAAELAATRATPAQILSIQRSLDEMADESQVEAHISADLRFHLGILEAAGNDLLLGLRHSIEGALTIAIGYSTHSKEDGRTSLSLHGNVLQAITGRQPAAARAAMNVLVDRWAEDSLRIAATQQPKTARRTKPTAKATGAKPSAHQEPSPS
jgi:DNA-binding FadR family transcriptional regulator